MHMRTYRHTHRHAYVHAQLPTRTQNTCTSTHAYARTQAPTWMSRSRCRSSIAWSTSSFTCRITCTHAVARAWRGCACRTCASGKWVPLSRPHSFPAVKAGQMDRQDAAARASEHSRPAAKHSRRETHPWQRVLHEPQLLGHAGGGCCLNVVGQQGNRCLLQGWSMDRHCERGRTSQSGKAWGLRTQGRGEKRGPWCLCVTYTRADAHMAVDTYAASVHQHRLRHQPSYNPPSPSLGPKCTPSPPSPGAG